jgi:hypothetical protein
MFASWKSVRTAWRALNSDVNISRQLRRRYKPVVSPLEGRVTLSTMGGVPAGVAHAVHASAVVGLPGHARHGARVKFPGGSVVSNPGSHTSVKFPGGSVNSTPGSSVVKFPGGSVTSGPGGSTVISFPGGSVVLG